MKTTLIGYPYIGEKLEWKKIIQEFQREELDESHFLTAMTNLQLDNLSFQQKQGIDLLTIGDFTYYDRILDLIVMFDMVPAELSEKSLLEKYYCLAFGTNNEEALPKKQWFSMNYASVIPHYQQRKLVLKHNLYAEQILAVQEHLGTTPRVSIIGPYTFAFLTQGVAKGQQSAFLEQLGAVYTNLLQAFYQLGIEWVQFEEPALTMDLRQTDIATMTCLYEHFNVPTIPNIMVTTYYESVLKYAEILNLPVQGIGLDVVNGLEENVMHLETNSFPQDKVLALGIVSGQNIWRTDIRKTVQLVQEIQRACHPKELWLQTSCHLQHVPISTANENTIRSPLHKQIAFADEKIVELVQVKKLLLNGEKSSCVEKGSLLAYKAIPALENEIDTILQSDLKRPSSYSRRKKLQQAFLQLPEHPTSLVSAPWMHERKKTATTDEPSLKTGDSLNAYRKEKILKSIQYQESLELDIFIHESFNSMNMVNYFARHLTGIEVTKNGWIVSSGIECIKPPIIFGDICWTEPITIEETKWAQRKSRKLIKGKVPGPVTMLKWSFVREDISRGKCLLQMSVALRKELKNLEQSGIYIIQIEEMALFEDLPIRKAKQKQALEHITQAVKIVTTVARDTTQIHAHINFSEHKSFYKTLAALNVDIFIFDNISIHEQLSENIKLNERNMKLSLVIQEEMKVSATINQVETLLKAFSLAAVKERIWITFEMKGKKYLTEETINQFKNYSKFMRHIRKDKVHFLG